MDQYVSPTIDAQLVTSVRQFLTQSIIIPQMASVEKQLLGTETVYAMRAQGVTSCICGLSANVMEESFLKVGANAFIQKPFPCEKVALTNEILRVLEADDSKTQQSDEKPNPSRDKPKTPPKISPMLDVASTAKSSSHPTTENQSRRPLFAIDAVEQPNKPLFDVEVSREAAKQSGHCRHSETASV